MTMADPASTSNGRPPATAVLRTHDLLAAIQSELRDIQKLLREPPPPRTPSLHTGLERVSGTSESNLLRREGPFVVLEALLLSATGAATVQIWDKPNAGPLQLTADRSNGSMPVTGHFKWVAGGVQDEFLVRIVATSGTWTVLVGFSDSGPAGVVDPYSTRTNGVLHRSAIATADKVAVPGALTVTDAGAGGALSNALRNVAVAAYDAQGVTTVSTGSVTPALNHRVRIAFAQVTGADGYDIFLSTAANPLWVGRITEAQRASGGILDAVGTFSAGGAAGSIDVGIDGTGVASNAPPFQFNSAYVVPGSITPISCAGYARAHVLVQLTVTDLRSAPTLVIVPFLQSQVSGLYHAGLAQTLTLLNASGASLLQDFELDVDGAANLCLLVDTITGQGAAMSCWVELM
jgi:hypothetical protein